MLRDADPVSARTVQARPLDSEGAIDREQLAATRATDRRQATERIAPRTEAERKVASIWQEVLGVPSLSVRDGFFALGGSSITALRLVALIQKEFGRQLPLASMTTETTVQQLAELLEAKEVTASATRASTLVPLRRGDGEPPLFLVHPAGGSVMFYVRLAHHLGGRPPVYGFQSPASTGMRNRCRRWRPWLRATSPTCELCNPGGHTCSADNRSAV